MTKGRKGEGAGAASENVGEGDEGAGGPDEDVGLEERLRRLEEIVASLEADEVDLDRALGLFEEGVRHVRAAERILSETELRVEELLDTGAEARTRPFGEEDAGTGPGDEGDGGA